MIVLYIPFYSVQFVQFRERNSFLCGIVGKTDFINSFAGLCEFGPDLN